MLQSGLTRLKSVFSEAKDSAKDSSKDSSKDTKDTAASHPRAGAASTLGHQETVEMDEVGWRGNKEFLLLI